jgi:ubiquinone/menaquinone biosynthesis C-methylase UbiE
LYQRGSKFTAKKGVPAMSRSIKSETFHAYEKAVIGTERARHTYTKRLDTICALSGGFDDKKILDIGCGFGFRTVGIAKSGASEVIGIDLEHERIQEAVEYSRQQGMQNTEFYFMDAASLEFEDQKFDILLADEMIHHLEDLPQVFSEMHRVIKNDGIVVISDHNRLSLPSELLRTVYFGKDKERVFTAKEVKKLLAAANFKDIIYKHIIFTLPFSNAPRFLLKVNYLFESIIESTPLLRTQCGVYVIRGIK